MNDLKIDVPPNKLGIDVSKNKLDAALIRTAKPASILTKKISNTPEGFEKLIQWSCQKASCSVDELHIIMEATGPYHERVALYMYEKNCLVSVVNPARIKKFAGSEGLRAKNDQLDSKVIARFGLKMDTIPWKPAPPEYHELGELLHRLEALKEDLQREKNRFEKLQSSASPSLEAIQSIQRSMEFMQNEKKHLETLIKQHIEQHPDLKKDQGFLESIPGIGPNVAPWMNYLLQHMTKFQSARQVAAFVGLTPSEYSSGESVYLKARLSKAGNPIYRQKLFMCAVVAIKYNPDVKALYERLLANGKSKMSALGAAMRKLVHICFGVIKNQTQFQSQIM